MLLRLLTLMRFKVSLTLQWTHKEGGNFVLVDISTFIAMSGLEDSCCQ